MEVQRPVIIGQVMRIGTGGARSNIAHERCGLAVALPKLAAEHAVAGDEEGQASERLPEDWASAASSPKAPAARTVRQLAVANAAQDRLLGRPHCVRAEIRRARREELDMK